MNPITVDSFQCSICKRIYSDQDIAEKCCKKYNCRFCGKEVADNYRTVHTYCLNEDRLQKAELLESWDSWVYVEDLGHNEGYFPSIEELLDYVICFDQDLEDKHEFAFLCKEIPFRKLDIGDLIEQCTQDSFEDAEDQISGEKELQLALETFNKANESLVSYQPDYTKKIKIYQDHAKP